MVDPHVVLAQAVALGQVGQRLEDMVGVRGDEHLLALLRHAEQDLGHRALVARMQVRLRLLDHHERALFGKRAQHHGGNRLVHAVAGVHGAHPHAALHEVHHHARTVRHVRAHLHAELRQARGHHVEALLHLGEALRLVQAVQDEVRQPLLQSRRISGAVRDVLDRGVSGQKRVVVAREAAVRRQVERILEPLQQSFLGGQRSRVIIGCIGAATVAASCQREEQPARRLDDTLRPAVPRPCALAAPRERLLHALGRGFQAVRHLAGTVVERDLDAHGLRSIVAVRYLAEVAEAQQVVVVADLLALQALLDEGERLDHRGLPGGVETGEHRNLREVEVDILQGLEVLQMNALEHDGPLSMERLCDYRARRRMAAGWAGLTESARTGHHFTQSPHPVHT